MIWAIITYISVLLTVVSVLLLCAIAALGFKTVRHLYHNNILADKRLSPVFFSISIVVGVIATIVLEFNQ